jgi:murein L,D-transpeptidase YcbB/YkuD
MSKRSLALIAAVILLLCCIAGCKGCKAHRHKRTQSEAIYTTQQFSDYIVDSTLVEGAVERDTTLRPFAEDILEFYGRRHYQAAWLNEGTLTASAYDFLNTLSNYKSDFGDSSLSAGLDDATIGAMLFSGSAQSKAMLDLRLTATFFRYAGKAYGGTEVDLKDLEWYIPRMKKNYHNLIDSLVTSPGSYSIYEPVNPYYKALKKVLVQYRNLEKKGGKPTITITTLPLRIGDSTDAVIQLKKLLTTTGDYTDSDMNAMYTDTLAYAVRSYQQRMGLRETGTVDSLTLAEINTPIGARIRQIMLNMERLRWMPDSAPAAYILVNITEYRLHVYEHDTVAWSMDVVVGNAATATSIFTGRLSVVDFCPYWNVPQSIIKNELLPKLKQNPAYLSKLNMEIVNGSGEIISPSGVNWHKYTKGVPFVIRQRPGPQNSLGLVAFFFPNSFDIFLHDTPAKSFFNESSRAFSHGCIRLAEPERLADYIFRSDSAMQPDHIRELLDAHQERKVAVRPSIPVYIVYFTAWVDHLGRINFRHDIYGHDAKLAKEIFGK